MKTLLQTVGNEELEDFYSNEMSRFASLFGRYLQEEGPSVDWNRIEKLPSDAVMDYTSLTAPTDENVVSKPTNLDYNCNVRWKKKIDN